MPSLRSVQAHDDKSTNTYVQPLQVTFLAARHERLLQPLANDDHITTYPPAHQMRTPATCFRKLKRVAQNLQGTAERVEVLRSA